MHGTAAEVFGRLGVDMKKMLWTALAVFMGIVAGAFARTVDVVEQTAKAVMLKFGGADGNNYRLFLAHGEKDYDDAKHEWPGFVELAPVAANENFRTYEVPARFRDGRYLRFFLQQTKDVAFAKEVRAVRSTGQQWVDTGVSMMNNNRYVCDFRFGDVTYTHSTAFFGQQWTGSRYLLNQQSNTFYFHSGGQNFGITPTSGTDYRCVVDDESVLHFWYGDNYKRIDVNRAVNSANGFAVFGCITGDHLAAFRFDRMKLGNRGMMVRDFIPAVDASGEAGIYDQVGNKFYKSKTATPLVADEPWNDGRDGRVLDQSVSFKFRRAVTVTAATADKITFAFDNPDGSNSRLFVASGTVDRKDAKNSWTSFEPVVTVTPQMKSYEYTIPDSLKQEGVFYRFFLLKTENLPFLAEVSSLTSTAAQWVRIGYVPTSQTTTDFTFGNVIYESGTAFFGQCWYGEDYLLDQQGSTQFYYHGRDGQAIATVMASTNYHFLITPTGEGVLDWGASRASCTEPARPVPFACEITVFGTYGMKHAAKFRFDSLKFAEAGFPVRDLVPVVANGKGALFDRLNGEVWPNLGSTDFTRGSAVAVERQGWVLDTTGTFAGGESRGAWWKPLGDAVAVEGDRVTLTRDCDFTAVLAEVPSSTVVDPNGHRLRMDGSANPHCNPFVIEGSSGMVEIFVDEGANFTYPPIITGGPLSVVKRGAGTLTVTLPMQGMGQLEVAEGILKMGHGSAFARNVPVTVRDGAAFDFAGFAGNAGIFTVVGSGPDGQGVLRNTGAADSLGNNQAQMAGIILAGDALIKANGHMGLINWDYAPSTFELNGHTLTIDYAVGRGFWLSNASGSTAGTVHVLSGIPYFYNGSYAVNLPNVDFVMEGPNTNFHVQDGSKITVRDVILNDGATFDEGNNRCYLRNVVVNNSAVFGNYVKWIYTSGDFVVSNETETVTVLPPFTANSTYPRLVKQGAGTLVIANNHTDQRFDRGADIQGGTVVMDSTASTLNYHVAISSAAAPVYIHAGGTLDMTKCTQPVKFTTLDIEPGGTLLHTASNAISFPNGTTFTKPEPFEFSGTVSLAGTVAFDLTELFNSANVPVRGSTTTLLKAGAINGSGTVTVKGCPIAYQLKVTEDEIALVLPAEDASVLAPIKICALGGNYVYGVTIDGVACSFRGDLAAALAVEGGWNVQMTGWRKGLRGSTGLNCGPAEWAGYSGVVDHALKTSATRAGILEGLETFCIRSGEPDFTLFVCGDTDVQDGVADATILENWKEAVSRIRSALPMTTVLGATIPGGSSWLNSQISAWCATQPEVECVDLTSIFTTTTPTRAQFAVAAGAFKTKLFSLATKNGKNTPTAWTRPALALGAENNVPAEYLNGFTLVRSADLAERIHLEQNLRAIPYSYAPPMQETGIAKVGYYVELVHKETGALQALWVDMDAPGPNWSDVCFPVTVAQQKQMAVNKLHVWSNSRAVTQVPAADDSVGGWIEFNCLNYNQTERTPAGGIPETWAGTYGFDDTFNTSGASGHGCFQLMRKFADGAVPAGEILFAFNRWGATSDNDYAIGIGSLANFGNLGYNTTKEIDRTFCYGGAGTEGGILSSPSFSLRRVSFYLKYNGTPVVDRAAAVDASWTGDSDNTFWTLTNWKTVANAAPGSADNAVWRLPEGKNVSFAYPNVDGVVHEKTTLLVDGTAQFLDVGGFYMNTLDVGANGRLVFDPTVFSWRLRTAPTFQPGGKFALPSAFASNTRGRFLLFTVDKITEHTTDADYANAFDTASAHGLNPKITVERLANGGAYIWLDLDEGGARETMNVLCIGDSITQGSDSTYGNWRTLLMKKIESEGYRACAKGFWTVQSADINGQPLPEDWTRHAGISAQRIRTVGGAGTLDGIEPALDQAGDVDFVLLKLGTNDINGDNTDPAVLYTAWKKLADRILERKPHAKLIAGAVVDIAYDAAKNDKVVAFNNLVRSAVNGGAFPAGRAFFADLYTPCYRYDIAGTFIPGSFYSATDLHPDWPGEAKMATTYLAAMKGAIASADAAWQLNAQESVDPVDTVTGIENNVPAADRAGFKLARVLDVAKHGNDNFYTFGYVPYAEGEGDSTAAVTDLSRVGYYVELRRKNNNGCDYRGLTRWLWVTVDAFGGRTLADVGVPLTTIYQGQVNRLRVMTNMPGISSTPEGAVESGWAEFWPSSYTNGAGSPEGPANFYAYDWNDTRSDNMSGFGSMQIHRIQPAGEGNPAQVLFAFNRWTVDGGVDIGLGNFANAVLGSTDWTFSGDASKGLTDSLASGAYEIARIEIWTQGGGAPGAVVEVTGVFTEGGETTVLGSIGDLGEDATSATVTLEWSTDPDFGTVAGSQTVGMFDGKGPISAKVQGLAAGSTWYFRFTSVNSAGKGETSETSVPYAQKTALWRPQSAADTWGTAAWLVDGARSMFSSGWAATIDGNESAWPSVIAVDDGVKAALVTVDAARDYTLGGSATLTAGRFVKKGAGTLTLEGGVLGETRDIVVEGGVMKLGDNAEKGAAGADGGVITVKNGGQFDVNNTLTASGNGQVRTRITSGKKFVIEGAGPDGKGALIAGGTSVQWSSFLNEVELTGDATIGGTARFDLRGNPKNSITGPDTATLTVANTADPYGLDVHGPISVGKLVVAAGANLTREGNASTFCEFNVPNGIDLYGTLQIHNSHPVWNTPGITAKGTQGVISCNSTTSYVDTSVTVPADAVLTFAGSANMQYTGPVNLQGTIRQTSGKHYLMGPVTATAGGTYEVTGGNLFAYPGSDWSQADLAIKMTGGQIWWGDYGIGDFPKPKSLDTTGITAGTIAFVANAPETTIVSGFTGARPTNVYVLNETNDQFTRMEPGDYAVNGRVKLANAVKPGFLKIGDGVTVTAPQLFLGDDAGNARRGHLEIGEGATFNVTSQIWIGHYPDLKEGQLVVLNGGTFNYTGTEGVRVGVDSYKAYFDMNYGTANVSGIMCRREFEVPADYEERFTVNGGTLNIGSVGIKGFTRYKPFLEFNNGTINATADFVVEQLRSVSFGNEPGGEVAFNIGSRTIDWRTGLRGKADVRLAGNGTFKSGVSDRTKLRFQGVPTGHWTIANQGVNNLYGAAGFAGGLKLEENVTASLKIAGSNLIECAFLQGCPFATAQLPSSLPFAANDMGTLHGVGDANDYSSSSFVWQGQFYCDTPGTWSFAGTYDDNESLTVDGKKVFETTGWQNAAAGQIELTAGWHDFRITQYQGGGGWGPSTTTGWSGTKSIGFAKRAVDGTAESNYTKFDGDNLPMRPSEASRGADGLANWSSVANFNADTWDTRTDLVSNGRMRLSDLHTYNLVTTPGLNASTHQLDGYVYVTAEQAGVWAVYTTWDDRISFQIDGRDCGSAPGSASTGYALGNVGEGWHTFRIRLADNTGSWGPWSNNVGWYCRVTVNGRDYLFDEHYFRISTAIPLLEGVERAGLDGVVELAAGSQLQNDAADSCPIWGTLKGAGTLSGMFAFKGPSTCYEVSGSGVRRNVENRITFDVANNDCNAELHQVRAIFGQKPGAPLYDIGAACGVDVSQLAVEVFDTAGNDYTEEFTAFVQDNRLLLKNAHPSGMALFFR